MGELVVAGKGKLGSNTYTLDSHDGDGAHAAADGEIDERILATIARSNAVDHDDGEDNDDEAIEEEAGLDGVVENLVNGLDVLVRRGVKDDDDGAYEAHGTAEFAQGS